MSEGQIQDAVMMVLNNGDALFFRNNIGVAVMGDERHVRFGVGGPGGSDLVGSVGSQICYVEIKTPTGRQREDQRVFQALVERKGAIYVILRSVDDAIAWLERMRAA